MRDTGMSRGTGYHKEETQGRDGLVVGGPGGVFFVHQMQKIPADRVGIEARSGRRAEEEGELLEVMDVALDGSRRAIAELEVVG